MAAVAASCDLDGFVYNFHSSLQPPTVEIIKDLGLIIKKQLIQFKANTKELPSSILFFRDGVSEGQFDIVSIPLCFQYSVTKKLISKQKYRIRRDRRLVACRI